MAKKNTRHCPALNKQITSAECGEGRHSKCQCPAECPFNPWAPDAYEEQGMRIIANAEEKAYTRARKEGFTMKGNLASANVGDQMMMVNDLFSFFFKKKDANGRTFFERWESERFKGLTNDERVFLRGFRECTLTVLETRMIGENGYQEVADLVRAPGKAVPMMDLGMAELAARFDTMLTWTYQTPHYLRSWMTGLLVPDAGDLGPMEVLREVILHHKGPAESTAWGPWLEENLPSVTKSLMAIPVVIRRKMIESVDARTFHTDYALAISPAEARKRLQAVARLDENDLENADLNSGFVTSLTWLDGGASPNTAPDLVLGTVLLGPGIAKTEAFSQARQSKLRPLFEKALGDAITFKGEQIRDNTANMLGKTPAADSSLVPESILKYEPKLEIQTHRIDTPRDGESDEDTAKGFRHNEATKWLGSTLPALNGLTPRQAAADPDFRPTLISIVKSRIRTSDRARLARRPYEDADWIARELGLTEIDVPAPPDREKPVECEEVEDAVAGPNEFWDYPELDPNAPIFSEPLIPQDFDPPRNPIDKDELFERQSASIAKFKEPNDASRALADAAPDLCEIVFDILEEFEVSYMSLAAMQLSMALVTDVLRVPPKGRFQLDAKRFGAKVDKFCRRIEAGQMFDRPNSLIQLLQRESRQPFVVGVCMAALLQAGGFLSGNADRESILCFIIMVIAIDELDVAMQGRKGLVETAG